MVSSPETFYQNELNDADLYERISTRIMSSIRKSRRNQTIAKKLMELSAIESSHARFWAELIKKKGNTPPPFKKRNASYYSYLGFLQRIFGISFLVRYLERGEEEAIKEYSDYIERESKEQWERDQLNKILADERDHEDVFIKMTNELKGNADTVRDAIYGMSDGLIEVLASVAGLTGVFINSIYVAVGGIVFGASGLISMTIGAYLSEHAKGQISTRGEYSPRKAAGNTALYYFFGAIVPIVPFLFLQKYTALITAFCLVLIVDIIVTSVISIQSSGRLRRDLLRSVGLVTLGFLATFAIGMIAHHFIGFLG
ncbi:MAG: VIT1/CCC1 family protein [Thermoplasmatales archaeon]